MSNEADFRETEALTPTRRSGSIKRRKWIRGTVPLKRLWPVPHGSVRGDIPTRGRPSVARGLSAWRGDGGGEVGWEGMNVVAFNAVRKLLLAPLL